MLDGLEADHSGSAAFVNLRAQILFVQVLAEKMQFVCLKVLPGRLHQIAAAIGLIWSEREDRYSELRAAQSPAADPAERRVEMHYIGG